MTARLAAALPAHYPCQTSPGPTWHGLVDLIELDVPACFGIVCCHENLPAVPAERVDKRGICNTLAHLRLGVSQGGGGGGLCAPSLVPRPAWTSPGQACGPHVCPATGESIRQQTC